MPDSTPACSLWNNNIQAEGAKHLSPFQRWHWGSCAKALTATVLASVVDEGTFLAGWDTRLGDILDLPEPSKLPRRKPKGV